MKQDCLQWGTFSFNIFKHYFSLTYEIIHWPDIKSAIFPIFKRLVQQESSHASTLYLSASPASGKEPVCQCPRHKRHRFSPWLEKIPWRRAWQPTPVLLSGGVWQAAVRRATKRGTWLKPLSTHHHQLLVFSILTYFLTVQKTGKQKWESGPLTELTDSARCFGTKRALRDSVSQCHFSPVKPVLGIKVIENISPASHWICSEKPPAGTEREGDLVQYFKIL